MMLPPFKAWELPLDMLTQDQKGARVIKHAGTLADLPMIDRNEFSSQENLGLG